MELQQLPSPGALAPHSHTFARMSDRDQRQRADRRCRTGVDAATDSGAADASVPGVVLPDQFFAGRRSGLPESPEKRLMFAVLLDAISRLRQRYGARGLEAERWIQDDGDEGIFSFANVCAVLGFEPRSLAAGLLAESSPLRRRAPLRHPRPARLRVTTPGRRGERRGVAAG